MEVVGVEPTSEKRVSGASTCVSFYSKSRRACSGRRPTRHGSQPCFVSGCVARPPHPLIRFSVVPVGAANQGPPSGRHEPFLGRESEVIVRSYIFRYYEWKLDTPPLLRFVPRRNRYTPQLPKNRTASV